MPLTTDPDDPRLGHGVDSEPKNQNEAYLVLSPEEIAKGYVRPVRDAYVHLKCGTETTMPPAIAQTYARDPKFYGATYCCRCCMHLSVNEFVWSGTNERVGS